MEKMYMWIDRWGPRAKLYAMRIWCLLVFLLVVITYHTFPRYMSS